jgi:spore coat polysaccharide biosynthesis protein SpsF
VFSSRLRGKVFKPMLGAPMLARQLAYSARDIDCLIVAAAIESSDSEVAAVCGATSTRCNRGSLDDVLDCCYRAANRYRTAYFERLTDV